MRSIRVQNILSRRSLQTSLRCFASNQRLLCEHNHGDDCDHDPVKPPHLTLASGDDEDRMVASHDVRQLLINQQLQSVLMPRPARGSDISDLLDYNEHWSDVVQRTNPAFFTELAKQQNPQYLWIGCADSRVPANQVVGLAPGEVFVHRNVANVVSRSDLNCLACLQFAVEVLKVEHVIVCGHYGCGGVNAALNNIRVGLADNWISHVVDVKNRFLDRMEFVPVENRLDALCELNVISQLANVAETHVMRDWWSSSSAHRVDVHGWCYGLKNGRVNPLMSISSTSDIRKEVKEAVERTFKKYAVSV